jgi:hypothetical protein
MSGSSPSAWRALALGSLLGLSCLVVAGLVTARSMDGDFDRDGTPDSVCLGRFDLHWFASRPAGPDPAGPFRLYDAPATYMRVVAGQAFTWDGGYELESGGGRESTVTVVRVKEPEARISVRIEDWRGWARVTVEGSEASRPDQAVAARVFEVIEDLLYRDLPRARSLASELGPSQRLRRP